MRAFNRSLSRPLVGYTLTSWLSCYLFFLITFTSASVFAYKFETNSNGIMKLAQDDSGAHLVHISGCSFDEGSQGEMDAYFAMANWNNPVRLNPLFRGQWVDCRWSQESGRWSRKNDLDNGNRLISQIIVTDHLGPRVVGHIDRTRNFARSEAVAFTIFLKPNLRVGETNACDTAPRANLRSTLNHELGHALGFNHTQVKRWGTMRSDVLVGYYCDVHTNETLSNSFPDDLTGLYSVYGTSTLPQYRATYYDLAALAYENRGNGDGTSSISRADPADNFDRYCPGDTIPDVEFSVANRGNKKLKYTRTFWSSPTPDLSSSDKSVLFWHSNRTKSPGARNGIYQGKKDLYFNNNDLPPVGETWFLVMQIHDVLDENNQPLFFGEDRTNNNAMVHSHKIRRHPSCP